MANTQTEHRTRAFVCPELTRWIEAFLNAKRAQGLSDTTSQFYGYRLRRFADWCLSKQVTAIEGITPVLLREYLLHLKDEHHNPGGLHGYYRAIRALLFWYEAEEESPDWKNPIRKVSAPRVPDSTLPPVSLDDIRRLVAVCGGGFNGTRDKAILLVLLDTGVRANELLSLDVSDFDKFSGALTIRRGKGGRSRVTFCGQRTRRACRAWLKLRPSLPVPLFCTTTGGRLTYGGLRQIIRRRAVKANVKTPALHGFRRANALTLLRNGTDVLTISRLLGHASLDIVRRYIAQTGADLQAAHAQSSPVDRGML